jgi:two-component system response regulator YesN
MSAVEAYSRRQFNLRVAWLDAHGDPLPTAPLDGPLSLPPVRRSVRDALSEAHRWGEPFIFFLCPGLIAWVVPMCSGDRFAGGILSGSVLVDEADRAEVGYYLRGCGMEAEASVRFASDLPLWPEDRPQLASLELYQTFYRRSGWTPLDLVRRRENAAQQRQIAEAIHSRKVARTHHYPIDEERRLLAMIRVGDRNGARGVLNQLLAALFVHAPGLSALRARTVELMGHLVRTAVEDNPLLEPLVEQNQAWVERLVEARDFDEICVALRDALDSFIDSVLGQTTRRGNPAAERALNYVSEHYTEPIDLATVAEAANLSVYRLAHLIKETTGRTVMQHVRVLRIAKARELLEKTTLSGAEIAAQLGFHDQSHFIREFRSSTGTTPLRYREGGRTTVVRRHESAVGLH